MKSLKIRGGHFSNSLFEISPMMMAMTCLLLMPMRIAYWLEDSLNATTRQASFILWLSFVLISILTCLPTIQYAYQFFILNSNYPSANISADWDVILLTIMVIVPIGISLLLRTKLFNKIYNVASSKFLTQ
jgi:hypothetical protein